jgi:glycosyltransferase involved in cell wall biosynthesis
MPTVTVVMPVYNDERFVGRAIDSILAQDFQDFEFIVINDGSTDGTARVLENIQIRVSYL